jgi:hypothetical protein
MKKSADYKHTELKISAYAKLLIASHFPVSDMAK